MNTKQYQERSDIEPENLIGTKWIAWTNLLRDRMKVEFVDKTNCIYTSEPKTFKMTYTVRDGNLYISSIDEPFELRGQILFNSGLPAFEKAA